MSAPAVSVVLPVRNGERFLDEALASVFATGYEPLEVLVVDGHSADGTRAIAERYPVRWIDQDGLGLAEAWNQGIAAARGELIAFIEADDRWWPGKLASQAALLLERPELEYVTGQVQCFLEPGSSLPRGFKPELLERARPGPIPGAMLARRALFDRLGGFDPAFRQCADVDWFARMADAGVATASVTEVVLWRRVHEGNMTNDTARGTREMLMALRRSVQRRTRGVPHRP